MVLGHRHDKAGAGVFEKLRPFRGVEALGSEHGDEVLVTEFAVVAPGLTVMLIGRVVLEVHAPRIPFIAVGGYTVGTPMDEDAKLGVDIPVGNPVLAQRFPGWFVFVACRGHLRAPGLRPI